MKHYALRKVELNHVTPGLKRAAKDTLRIFRDAVTMLCGIALAEWGNWKDLDSSRQLTYLEELVHSTRLRRAKYPEFDRQFYKFPSYFRRSAIHAACGQVASYLTRLSQYHERRDAAVSNGRRFKEKAPSLNFDTSAFPSMYNGQMYKMDGCCVQVKLYIRNTWDWVTVSMPVRDRKSLDEALAHGGKLKSPKFLIQNKKLYLQFPVMFPGAVFPGVPVWEQAVLGVDLGVNRGAVCSAVRASGTVHGRCFDPFTSERDRINHMLNRLRKLSAQSGRGQSLSAFYTKLDGLKMDYTRKLARWIVDRAIGYGVYGIVMERLGRMRGRGRKKDRIHHWCKKQVFSLVKGMALRAGIRVFEVNPKNTSALAFDGSGRVTRGEHNFSLCIFTSGKRYDCDLSSFYKIAARYFIRAVKKSMKETEWSQCVAEVPALVRRTDCTLSTLWQLYGTIHTADAAA